MEVPLTNMYFCPITPDQGGEKKRGFPTKLKKNHDVNIHMWNFRSCAVLFTLTESNLKSSMCNPWRRCNIFNVPNSVMIGFIYIKNMQISKLVSLL